MSGISKKGRGRTGPDSGAGTAARSGPEVVTLGETCVVFEAAGSGLLRYASTYERRSGGAETNVAVALVRLGHSAGWISRVGADEFGHYLVSLFRGEGVDVSRVKADEKHPTGLFFRQRSGGGGGKNYSYRKGSAASFLDAKDLDEAYVAGARILHVTGITPALGPCCRRAVFAAMKLARRHGVKVSFDPNLRLRIWNAREARRSLGEMLDLADILLPSEEECRFLFGTADIDEVYRHAADRGAGLVVIKRGAGGAIARGGKESAEVAGLKVPVVDTFGAGDAFDAGFLAGWLRGWNLQRSLELANAVAALSVTVRGNVEAYPTQQQVEQFLGGGDSIIR